MTRRNYNLKCLHYQLVFNVHVSPTIVLNTLRHWGHYNFTLLKRETGFCFFLNDYTFLLRGEFSSLFDEKSLLDVF